MTTRELARYLLEKEDKPFFISIDLSTEDETRTAAVALVKDSAE